MAFVVQSVSTNSSTATAHTGLTINKPTGLAVGDLMVSIINAYGGTDLRVDLRSGWTNITTTNNAAANILTGRIQYKAADASDVAASNFAFTYSGDTADLSAGAIMRITGHGLSSLIAGSDADTNAAASSATVSFSTSISPLTDGSLVIMGILATDTGNQVTTSNYSVTPSGVTFTELFDLNINAASVDPVVAAAYGIQTTKADITNYGALFSAVKTAHQGMIAVLTPAVNASADISHIAVTPALTGLPSSNTATATASHIEITPTLDGLSSTEDSGRTRWDSPNKPSSTWINPDK